MGGRGNNRPGSRFIWTTIFCNQKQTSMADHLDAPIDNTPYSDEELEHFRDLLKEEERETEEELENLKESEENLRANDDDEVSSQDHHPGDRGNDEGEKETNYILMRKQRDKLKEIRAALDRIDRGTYGVCEDTGQKIKKERLEAIPYARFSLEAKQKDEDAHPGPLGSPTR